MLIGFSSGLFHVLAKFQLADIQNDIVVAAGQHRITLSTAVLQLQPFAKARLLAVNRRLRSTLISAVFLIVAPAVELSQSGRQYFNRFVPLT